MKTLITGGAGFIGSTVASACADAGLVPVVLDDLSTGRVEFARGRHFYCGDVADGDLLTTIFAEHPDISSVIHCAARIVVPDSVQDPLGYYANNVAKTIELVRHLVRLGCERLVFSSSASILRASRYLTVDETSTIDPQSPYAATKTMVERVLEDAAVAYPLRVLSLRYFNPIGADPSLRTGQQLPSPNHALGLLITANAAGQPFTITGVDWPTRDGSAIRDYIHVWDLAQAHVAAIHNFDAVLSGDRKYDVVNLGTGTGTTVRELVAAFREVVDHDVQVNESGRRPGDVVGAYTTGDKAERLLAWTAQRTVEDGIRDSLRWMQHRAEILGS